MSQAKKLSFNKVSMIESGKKSEVLQLFVLLAIVCYPSPQLIQISFFSFFSLVFLLLHARKITRLYALDILSYCVLLAWIIISLFDAHGLKEMSSLRYVLVFIILLIPFNPMLVLRVFILLGILNFIVSNIDFFESIYRLTSGERHALRSSGTFLFPGDLGTFGALFQWILAIFLQARLINIKLFIFGSVLAIFLVMASGSRIGLFLLLQAVLFFMLTSKINKSYRVALIVIPVVFGSFYLLFENSYLFHANLFDKFILFLNGTMSQGKRFDDLLLFYDSFPNSPSEAGLYFESGLLTMWYRHGWLFPILFHSFVLAFFLRRKSSIMMLGLVGNLLFLNFFTGVFDRPKLSVLILVALVAVSRTPSRV